MGSESNDTQQRIYKPMFTRFGIKDDEEFLDLWDVFRTLPQDIRDVLISQDISEKIQEFQKKYQLSDDSIASISSVVREMFFNRVQADSLDLYLRKNNISNENTQVVIDFILKEILPLRVTKENLEEMPAKQTATLILLGALAQYPRINDQALTSNRLQVRNEKEQVRGSVRNWLRAYRDVVGARNHTAIERGQFLFHSENTKKLASAERDRLALVLKSLDDNEILTIDVEKQEIVFPRVITPQVAPIQTPLTAPTTAPVKTTTASNNNPLQSAMVTPKQGTSFQVTKPTTAPLASPAIARPMPLINPVQKPQIPAPTPIASVDPTPAAAKRITPMSTFNFSRSSAPTPAHVLPSSPAKLMSQQPVQQVPPTPQNRVAQSSQVNVSSQKPPMAVPTQSATKDPFHFSSGQVLPAEKQGMAPKPMQKQINATTAPLSKPPLSV